MFKVTKYPHGTFSWADCNSTNSEKAKKFYMDLMDWEANDMPLGEGLFYTMLTKDGETVTAVSPMMAEMQQQGIPSHWSSYITVDDVDALVDKVAELGGKVMAPPFDVFDSGRMMVIQDPSGANVGLWQAQNHIGASLVNTPGAMGWNELLSNDRAKAMEFYKGLLGWEYQKDPNQDYYMILNNGRMNGGMMQITKEMGDMPSYWMVYFNVADIDAAVKKVEALGGTIHMRREAPGVGPFAIIGDPTGAVMTIIQLEEPQPWTEN
jgi:predicted enzyme related to lactoylglutathione lyase